MRCVYRFSVEGKIHPEAVHPVNTKFYRYEFGLGAGFITEIIVSVAVSNRTEWPLITPNPAPGVRFQINMHSPHLPFIQHELRTLQGILSIFGLRSIDVYNPKTEWKPDTAEERQALQLFAYERERKELTAAEAFPLKFDLLARAVLAADSAEKIQAPLNFFRRGMRELYDRQFIEAIRAFFFVVETVYGQGKFKKAALVKALLSSRELVNHVTHAVSDWHASPLVETRLRGALQERYGNASVDNLIERFVELRGEVHHHTPKRKGVWNPEYQERYEVEALLLQAVGFNVIFALLEPHMWSNEVMSQYQRLMTNVVSQGGASSPGM